VLDTPDFPAYSQVLLWQQTSVKGVNSSTIGRL